jgi:hypothetical protein
MQWRDARRDLKATIMAMGRLTVLTLALALIATPTQAGFKDWWDSMMGGKKEGETKPAPAASPKVSLPPPDQEVYRLTVKLELGEGQNTESLKRTYLCDMRFGEERFCSFFLFWPKDKKFFFVRDVQVRVHGAARAKGLFSVSMFANGSGSLFNGTCYYGTVFVDSLASDTVGLDPLAKGLTFPIIASVSERACELPPTSPSTNREARIGTMTVVMVPASDTASRR